MVKYSQEQKLVAVQTLLVDKVFDYNVAAKNRIYRATLYNWKQRLRKDEVVSVVQKPTAVAEGIVSSQVNKNEEDLVTEIPSLQAQIQHLRMERDVLEMATISSHVENVIKRDFHTDFPNTKWLTDITEFSLPTGKVYLSPIIDCFDGLVVSWSIEILQRTKAT